MKNSIKAVLLSVLLIAFVSCYAGMPEKTFYPVQVQQADSNASIIDRHIKDAVMYYDLGLYEMSYSNVYDALLLLNEAKERKDRRYNELMDLALKINFNLRDKLDLDYSERWVMHDKRRGACNKDIFPLEIGKDKAYLSDAYMETVYMVGEMFIPYFRSEMARYEVPVEFSLLPLLESGFDPSAVSPKGAVGMWQFMEPTAESYGLPVNYWADKRLDPFASGKAAARYLSYLYERFGKWELALAAYNCGETRLARIIESIRSDEMPVLLKSGMLPGETENYVRSFMYLIDNIDLSYFQGHHNITHVVIPFSIRVADLLRYIDISEADFYFLNPDIKKGIIPYSAGGYTINIYTGTSCRLADIDEKHLIHWNSVRIDNDMSVEELVEYLNVPRGMIMHLGSPDSRGIIKKGTRFIYPRDRL